MATVHSRAKDLQRPRWYAFFFAKRCLDQILYPVTQDQLPAIEHNLKRSGKLFTFWDDEGKGSTPIYISMKPYANPIELLSWETGGTDGTNNDSGSDYIAWIKNLSAFLSDIIAANPHTLLCCNKCLGYFQSLNVFDLLRQNCRVGQSYGQAFMLHQPGKWSQLSLRNISLAHVQRSSSSRC